MIRLAGLLLVCAVVASCAGTSGISAPLTTKAATRALSAADYEQGQIFLFPGPPARYKGYLEFFPGDQLVDAVEFLRKRHAVDSIPSNESPHTVLFVYTGKIPPGTTVTTTHQFESSSTLYRPFVFTYESAALPPNRPLIILNLSHSGSTVAGKLNYRLYFNKTLVSHTAVAL